MGEQGQAAGGAWQVDAAHLAAGDTILVEERPPALTVDASSSPPKPRPRRKLAPGEQFGRFTLLDRLGAGGMGVVYAAYDPELDRKVAIKFLIHRAAQKPTSAARLLREAKALARLNHPGVITVHDVGAVNSQVFIAMEYVEGKTLRAWSEAQKRDIRDILKVYISAGRGLAAAHKAGLVHRDFKPENVLIGNDGRVRVLDFGLARAADGDSGSSHPGLPTASISGDSGMRETATPDPTHASYSGSSFTGEHSGIALLSGLSVELTQDGAIVGTPAYMAPEQHLGKVADARSDQFAFCVALWEAFYGQKPFQGSSAPALVMAITRGKQSPPPPGNQVPNWINRILQRGLNIQRNERFPSMDALLTALERDPTRVRRRRLRVATLVLAIGSAAAMGIYNFLATPEAPELCLGSEDKLEGVWDSSTKQLVQQRFLASTLPFAEDAWEGTAGKLDIYTSQWVTMHQSTCQATRVRGEQSLEVMDQRMACLDTRMVEVRALTELFSHASDSLISRAVTATDHLSPLDECADLEGLTSGERLPTNPADREVVLQTGETLARARAHLDIGEYTSGLALTEAAKNQLGDTQWCRGATDIALLKGLFYDRLGRGEEAEVELMEAYWTGLTCGYDMLAAEAARELVSTLGLRGQSQQALAWSRHARALSERLGERGKVLLGRLLDREGIVHYFEGNYELAFERQTEALKILEQASGRDSLEVAATLINLGDTVADAGRHGQARIHYKHALTIFERELGARHPHVAVTLNNLGAIAFDEGNYSDAIEHHQRALEIKIDILGPQHPSVANSLNNLGAAQLQLGQRAEARSHLDQAREIKLATLGADHILLAETYAYLGELEALEGRYEQALQWHQQARDITLKTHGSDHPKMVSMLGNLGQIELQLQNYERATALLAQADTLLKQHPSAVNQVYACRIDLARSKLLWRQPSAQIQARKLVEDCQAKLPTTSTLQADLKSWLSSHPIP